MSYESVFIRFFRKYSSDKSSITTLWPRSTPKYINKNSTVCPSHPNHVTSIKFIAYSLTWVIIIAKMFALGWWSSAPVSSAEKFSSIVESGWCTVHSRTPNVMDLGTHWIHADKKTENLSQYINYSCNPNLEVVIWDVNGVYRAFICTLNDILPNSWLSFRYNSGTPSTQKVT